jgi:collagen type III alpha
MLVNIDLDDVASVVDDAINRAVAPLAKDVETLKAKPVEVVKGDPGIDGKDGAPGQDGKDGAPGLPGEPGPIGPAPTSEAIVEAMRAMPELAEIVREVAAAYLIENPPKDGKDGERGQPGEKGEKGDPARDGRDGLPGLQGEKGRDGIDGKDGLGIDDYEVALEDDGRFEVRRWMREGTVVKEVRLKRSDMIYREVWRPAEYLKGDVVSHGGSAFVATRDTSDKPETSDAWRLAIKRGRDGKDAKMLPPDVAPTVRLK